MRVRNAQRGSNEMQRRNRKRSEGMRRGENAKTYPRKRQNTGLKNFHKPVSQYIVEKLQMRKSEVATKEGKLRQVRNEAQKKETDIKMTKRGWKAVRRNHLKPTKTIEKNQLSRSL